LFVTHLPIGLLYRLLCIAIRIEQGNDALVFVEDRWWWSHESRRGRSGAGIGYAVDVLGPDAELVTLPQLQVPHFAHGLGNVVIELNGKNYTNVC